MELPQSCSKPLICDNYTITRYVDGTPTSEITLVTIRYIHPPHHGHTNQYHGHQGMTHILFIPCQSAIPFPEIRPFQTLTLKLQGQGRGCGQRARSYSRPSVLLTCFLFISYQSDKQFLIQLFPNFTLKHPRSRSWVRQKFNITYYTQHPTDAIPFCFT